jgi:hypothetical protein
MPCTSISTPARSRPRRRPRLQEGDAPDQEIWHPAGDGVAPRPAPTRLEVRRRPARAGREPASARRHPAAQRAGRRVRRWVLLALLPRGRAPYALAQRPLRDVRAGMARIRRILTMSPLGMLPTKRDDELRFPALKENRVTEFVGRLSDRILCLVAPRAVAAAATSGCTAPIGEQFCQCYGSRASYRLCKICDGEWVCEGRCVITRVC